MLMIPHDGPDPSRENNYASAFVCAFVVLTVAGEQLGEGCDRR